MAGASLAALLMFDDETATVLLCIANARDRSLLADRLESEGLDVVEPEGRTLPRFDLCLVDTRTYRRIGDELERRREQQRPVHLPVLLILGPNDSEAAVSRHDGGIDDVLSVPTSGDVLAWRVNSLLRTRQQSKQLRLFQRAIDDAVTGITIADASGDHELRYANDAFVSITGYEREEALGRNCRFLQGPETRAEPIRRIREALEAEKPVTAELRNYRKDGTMFWNHTEISPVYGESGVTHFVGFQEDITERVERTRTLKRFEHIVQAAVDPIYALDEDLRFTLVNEATTELCGCSEAAALGTDMGAVFGEQHREKLEATLLDLVESGARETTIETTVSGTVGDSRRYQTAISVLPVAEFEGVVCVSRDITADRQREARLSVLDRVLRHNLRNKLMVMLARTDAIQERAETDAIVEPADAIERAAEDLLSLAETARDFKETVDPEDEAVSPRNISKHITNAVQETGLEYDHATFSADVPPNLWATAHDSFELAIDELLERAAESGIAVDIAVSATVNTADETVRIRVRHDGETIDEEARAALSAGVESDLQHGMGLGLWFVRWMAINSGGSFEISGEDSGTVIELTLPLAQMPAA